MSIISGRWSGTGSGVGHLGSVASITSLHSDLLAPSVSYSHLGIASPGPMLVLFLR